MSPRHIDAASLEAREQELTRAALAVMAEEGVSGLTIDKVVSRVPYSKGTVYNHFSCKEDLLMALCNNCISDLLPLFRRAAEFQGSSRQQMLAIGYAYLLYARLYPIEFMLVISAKTPAVMERASETRRAQHQQLETALMSQLLQVITRAASGGELPMGAGTDPAQIAFTLWAMSFGTIALLHEGVDRCGMRAPMEIEETLVQHSNLVLDGLQWQPCGGSDSKQCITRFRQELFAAELKQLNARITTHPEHGDSPK